MKIGIYGGTFNPIHLGHLTAARAAVERLGLDRLLFIPAGLPPHKELAADTPSVQHRLEMTRLGAQALELPVTAEVCDMELRRRGKSYTADTVAALARQYPDAELWLLMGTDMFLSFQNWYKPQAIAKHCGLCAFGRSRSDTEELLRCQGDALRSAYRAKVTTLLLPEVVEISSTQLRESLRRGEGRAYLAPTVYGYILREGLYGTKADLKRLSLEDLRCVALTMLKHSRISHVLGAEETAAALARRWGADEDSARRAALLHDCTKRLNREQQLALCRQYHIEVDEEERREAKLLHAPTGAAVAAQVFGVSREVESAIRWHTTGKADMSLLEKIIYLADYIEPTRDFCDLRELRRLAFEDLDRALLLGFTMAVEDLREKGMPVHPNSVYARDHLKGILA